MRKILAHIATYHECGDGDDIDVTLLGPGERGLLQEHIVLCIERGHDRWLIPVSEIDRARTLS